MPTDRSSDRPRRPRPPGSAPRQGSAGRSAGGAGARKRPPGTGSRDARPRRSADDNREQRPTPARRGDGTSPPRRGPRGDGGGEGTGRASSRPARGSSGRPSGGGGWKGRSDSAGRDSGRDGGDGRRPGGRGDARSGPPRRSREERPTRPEPRNEAERRAAEVRARRAPRAPRDEDVERERIEARTTEQWVDEGSIRSEAEAATARAGRPPKVRPAPELDHEVVAEIHAAASDQKRAARLAERLAAASGALDRERFDDARRIVTPLLRDLPSVAAVHEVSGLAAYRSGRWLQAAESLETARRLRPDVALLPVLADSYRALKRWADVESVWRDLRESSPSHEVMAEGRIVVAGAYADRGDLREAVKLLQPAGKLPKRVREYHLRQWYALADLLDRAGDAMSATRWFREVLAHDANFADTRERLRSLGR